MEVHDLPQEPIFMKRDKREYNWAKDKIENISWKDIEEEIEHMPGFSKTCSCEECKKGRNENNR